MMRNQPGRFITRLLPWVMLCISIILTVYVAFSHWAINAERFGGHDADLALFFSLSLPFAVFVSIGIALLSLVLGGIYKAVRRRGGNVLLMAGLTGLLPVAYLVLLDLGW